MFSVAKKYVLAVAVCLLGIGQSFGANVKCAANTQWGEFTTVVATKVGDYYEIDTPAKLAWFACEVTKGNYSINAKLTQSIDLQKKVFIPIAAGKGDNGNQAFKGIFDGQGFVVSNLYINTLEIVKTSLGGNKDYAQNVGFVGVLGGGTVKNLILENVDIQASTSAGDIINNKDSQISVGAVVGWMAQKPGNNVEGCMVSGTIKTTGNGQGVGGIVGNAKTGTISNCMSLVEIQTSGSDAYIGGVIGITKTDVSVSSCVYAGPGLTNTGDNGLVGGIAGNVFTGNLTTEDDYYEGENINGIGGSICISKKNECTTENLAAAAASIAKADAQNVDATNAENYVCVLNGGTWNESESMCENSTSDYWSVGETGLSLNGYGKDGYKITFDANGGIFADGSVAKNKFLEMGLAITADEIGNPSRDYYTFIGWAFTQDATESENLGFVSQRDTVYAVWEEKIKVTFDADVGTFPDGSTTKDVYISKNHPITVDGLGSLPVSYCLQYSQTDQTQCVSTMYFMGWKNVTGEKIDFNNHDILATVDVRYNADWTDVETYSVTFHSDDNTTVDFVQWVDAGHTVVKPADPEMEGYTFLAWYDGNAPFDFKTEIRASKDLHAHWSPNQYNVSYDLSEGCTDRGDNPEKFTLGEGLLPLNPAIAEDGYVFEGWSYDAAFKQKATAIDRNVVGDKAFFAKCSKKTYRIMYIADNSSYGSTTDQYVEHGSSITLASEGIFWRTGYKQDGWTRTAGGDRDYVFGKVYTITEELTLYPHWVTNLEITSIGAVRIYDYGDHKEAVIDGNYGSENATDEVQIPNDVEVTKVTLNRKFEVGIMATIMLPFSIDADKLHGGKIYRFKGINEVDGKIKIMVGSNQNPQVGANTPYMFLPAAEEMTFDGSVILNTNTEPVENLKSEDELWEFKGTYKYIKFNGTDNVYGFAGVARSGDKVGKFVKNGGSGADIKSLRAYMENYGQVSMAKAHGAMKRVSSGLSSEIDVEIENEEGVTFATGKLNTATGELRIDGWFDLKGRRLNAKPTVQGTYYHNGKRIIVK